MSIRSLEVLTSSVFFLLSYLYSVFSRLFFALVALFFKKIT
jgi:hypothetical protein